MKKTLLVFTLALMFGLNAESQSNVIWGYVGDITQMPPMQSGKVTATLLNPNPRLVGTMTIRQAPKDCAWNVTNGYYSFTNLLSGYYRLDISGQYGTSFPFWVWPTTTGSVAVAALYDPLGIVPPTPETNFDTSATVDAKIQAAIAAIPSGTNGAANAVTNQPPSPGFFAAAKITDLAAQADVNQFVAKLSEWNIYTNMVFAAPLDQRFNPSNHVDLFGAQITGTGDTYTNWLGLVCKDSGLSAALPPLTNYTVVIALRGPTPDYLDQNYPFFTSGSYQSYQSVARSLYGFSLVNTNDSSLVALCRDNGNDVIVQSQGTTPLYAGSWGSGFNTNRAAPLLNGNSYRAVSPFGDKVFALQYSNGITRLWESTMPEAFNDGVNYTNTFVTPLTLPAMNRINIGMDNQWFTRLAHDSGFTNSNYRGTILSVLVFNGSGSNLVYGSYAALPFLDSRTHHEVVQGTSLMNYWQGAAAANPSFTPATNAIAAFLMAAHPEWYVHSESCPGAVVFSGSYPWAASYPITSVSLLPRSRTTAAINTDLYYNDAGLGGSGLTSVSNFLAFYSQYLPYAPLRVVIEPTFSNALYGVAANAQIAVAETVIQTNFPAALFPRWDTLFTQSSFLDTNISRDGGPHISGLGAAAHSILKQQAQILMGGQYPVTSSASTNAPSAISAEYGSIANLTNNILYSTNASSVLAPSIHVGNRQLLSQIATNQVSLDWDLGRAYDTTNVLSLDYQARQLGGNWTLNGSPVVTSSTVTNLDNLTVTNGFKVGGNIIASGNISMAGGGQIFSANNVWNDSYGMYVNGSGSYHNIAGYHFGSDFPALRGMDEFTIGTLTLRTNVVATGNITASGTVTASGVLITNNATGFNLNGTNIIFTMGPAGAVTITHSP